MKGGGGLFLSFTSLVCLQAGRGWFPKVSVARCARCLFGGTDARFVCACFRSVVAVVDEGVIAKGRDEVVIAFI